MRELLALPLLMPLGLALVVGLLNLTTPSRLRFLLWYSPPLSLGSWVMLGAGGGAALSAALSATAGFTAKRKPKPKAETWQAPAPKAALANSGLSGIPRNQHQRFLCRFGWLIQRLNSSPIGIKLTMTTGNAERCPSLEKPIRPHR
ncbi:MAG: hypothetical protein EBQ52_06765 [Synechococcaceae bacterium LLD_019]|nr:hypothetical protein [Synechococcaceae bacterium LLD_019]